jgi:hypothetical protein
MINRRTVIASAVGASCSLVPLSSMAQPPRMVFFPDIEEQAALADVAKYLKDILEEFFHAVNTAALTTMKLPGNAITSIAKFHNGIIVNEDFDWNAVSRDAIARSSIPSLIPFLETFLGTTGNVRMSLEAFVTAFITNFSNGFMVTYIEMMIHLHIRKHWGWSKQPAKWTSFVLAQAYLFCWNSFLITRSYGRLREIFGANEKNPELRRKLLAGVPVTDNGTDIALWSTQHTFLKTPNFIYSFDYLNRSVFTTSHEIECYFNLFGTRYLVKGSFQGVSKTGVSGDGIVTKLIWDLYAYKNEKLIGRIFFQDPPNHGVTGNDIRNIYDQIAKAGTLK